MEDKLYIDEKINDFGIYGIYIDSDLIYIGKTTRNFTIRFKEHMRKLNNSELWGTQTKLYAKMKEAKENGKKVHMEIVFASKDLILNTRGVTILTNRDLEAMEAFYITIMKPSCNLSNIQGVDTPYYLERF